MDGKAPSLAKTVDGDLGEGEMVSYTSELVLTNVQDKEEGWYQCVVTNDHGSTYSNRAKISVHGRDS